MSLIDRMPFWRRYFAELGIETVLSPMTDPRISSAGIEMAVAQPCYPVQVAHGHVNSLVDTGVDYILIPNMADAEGGEAASHCCPWNQTLPWVLRSAPALQPHQQKFLIPTLHFKLGPVQVKKGLAETMARIGVTRRASDRAVNCDVPRRLRHRYGANVIPLDFLVTGREPIEDVHSNMFWISGRKILEAARRC
jgi:predicted nucleotide-binding protein (sugar kinase/HSP70/actin superfamily)